MKKTLRGFGLAFFMIGAFITIVHYFQLSIPFTSLPGENGFLKKDEQQITKLETELKEAHDQIAQLEEQLTTVMDNDKTKETMKTNAEEDDEIVHGTLKIYSGITPYVVGQKLENLGIVDNGLEVEMYLARPEFSRSIQVGEFELNSGMTIEEIAKTITGKVKKEK